MEGENKETKITSVEKEKVKDPRRVEQAKRLAAISREAKERKARERAQRLKEEAEQQGGTESGFKFVSFSQYTLVPIVGIALGYYILYIRRSNDKEDRPEEREEQGEEEPRKKPKLEKL